MIMKITVDTIELKKAFDKIFKVTAQKSRMSVLNNILVTATENSLYLSSCNLEQFAKMRICANSDIIAGNCSFILSDTKAIVKAMKFFTGLDTILEHDGENVIITCEGKKAKQRTFEADEFPEFPQVGAALTNDFNYSNSKLNERFNAVNYAVHAVSKDGYNPINTGICFKNNDMVACDGIRIALNKDYNLSVNGEFVVPPNAIKFVNEVLSEHIHVETDSKIIQASDQNAIIISRLLEGEFFNYMQILESRGDIDITVNTADCINSLKYLKTFVNGQCGVTWAENKISVENSGGYFESEIDITENISFPIDFNADYMMEALSQFKGNVNFNIRTYLSPIIITSDNDSNNIACLVPMKLKRAA